METVTVKDILAQMQSWAGPGDPEIAHPRVDKLLVQLVRLLSAGRDDKQLVEEILQTWENVEKWYS